MTAEGSRTATNDRDLGASLGRNVARDRQHGLMTRLDAWRGQWAGAGDPILNLHYYYAVLCIASPLIFVDPAAWSELAQDAKGYAMIEKSRDAASELIRGICSPDFARTLSYSLQLLRTLLAFALCHLIAQATAFSQSQLTSVSHINQLLRTTYEALGTGGGDNGRGKPHLAGPTLTEIVETGQIEIAGRRDILGVAVGQDMWDRVLTPPI